MNEVCGLFSIMKANANTCLPLLSKKMAPLKKQEFMDLFETKWSDQGSNRRNLEEETIYSWEIFLQDIEGECIKVYYCLIDKTNLGL